MSLRERTGGLNLEWSDLAVLLAVFRAGSLSGAARLLGQNHSTVFRRINAIEERTSVRFFERLPAGYRMTEAGETALSYCERIESEVHALGREILGKDLRLQGSVRVTAPEGMTARILPALLTRFGREHPQIAIDVVGSTAALDLSRREAEVAIRATKKPPDASLGRRICDFHFALYSSEDYLQRHSGTPVHEMDWCVMSGMAGWFVPSVWKKLEHAEERIKLTFNSALPLGDAIAEGAGITGLPCYLGDADRRLKRVGQPLSALKMELWILTHPDLRHTARVRTLMEYLYESLKKQADLFSGELA